MKDSLLKMQKQAIALLAEAKEKIEIEELRVRFLGKKGEVTAILKQLGNLADAERKEIGALANEVREQIDNEIRKQLKILDEKNLNAQLTTEKLDVTLPGNRPAQGKRHPLQQVLDEIKEIFLGMGFDTVAGPEVEYDHYNFEMLNMPRSHPARDTQDTFYITENILLRTQTSPMQVRTMEKGELPIRVIVPGRVYRSDAVDATHSPLFHQIEGLVVDKGITFSDLKGTLEVIPDRKSTRLNSSH